jgi:hypothetical protein
LENAIRWVSGDTEPSITVHGKGLLESFTWHTEAGDALHLLNYTNPNPRREWIREFYPIGAQEVRFTLPRGASISLIELLRRECTIPFTRHGDVIVFTIPGIDDYGVAAIYSA